MFKRLSEKILALVILAVCVVFSPCLKAGFTNWDDPILLLENPVVRQPLFSNLPALLTTSTEGRYYPLTIFSYQLEYQFFGYEPRVYHLSNLFLHAANTALVFYLLIFLDLPLFVAALSALFFGIHPLQVESVLWVSGRKDLLSAFFCLWGLLVYARAKGRLTIRQNIQINVLFVASLLAKPMAVALPVVLLMYDYYNDRKLTARHVWQKLPLFFSSTLLSVVAVVAANQVRAFQATEVYTAGERVVLSLYAIAVYIVKLAAPHRLSVVYPFPEKAGGVFTSEVFVPAFLVLILVVLIFVGRTSRGVKEAALFFLMMILPVLHLVKVNTSPYYDRFVYLPSLGYGVLLASAVYRVMLGGKIGGVQRRWRIVVLSAAAVYVVWLGFYSRSQSLVWRDSGTLWSHVIRQYPFSVDAYINRGNFYLERGNPSRALPDFDRAVMLEPSHGLAYFNRGGFYALQENYPMALNDLTAAIRLGMRAEKDLILAYQNRGVVLARLGFFEEAIGDYTTALQHDAQNVELLFNRALSFYRIGKRDQALDDVNMVLGLRPDYRLAAQMKDRIMREAQGEGR